MAEPSPVIPLEKSDPWLAEHLFQIARSEHPQIKALFIGRETCIEFLGVNAKFVIILKNRKPIIIW
jgi:hypothetical protein